MTMQCSLGRRRNEAAQSYLFKERETEDVALAVMMLENNGRIGDSGTENYRFRRLLTEYPPGHDSSVPSFFKTRQLDKYSTLNPPRAREPIEERIGTTQACNKVPTPCRQNTRAPKCNPNLFYNRCDTMS